MEHLPTILTEPSDGNFPALIGRETDLLTQSRQLFDAGFYDHALLDIWNAAVSNLSRRVEAYGVDLFQSVVKDEPGSPLGVQLYGVNPLGIHSQFNSTVK